jgi:hypothetical protein
MLRYYGLTKMKQKYASKRQFISGLTVKFTAKAAADPPSAMD